MSENYIKVWTFYDAPEEYKKLSRNGGDEDHVAFVPSHLEDRYYKFLEDGTAFGCCCVDEYEVEGGKIYIGAHA